MSRHTTLQQYLIKRRAINNVTTVDSQPIASIADPISLHQDTWETSFLNSKRQCLDQLRRIRQNIVSEQAYINKWLETYETNVLLMMDTEYQKIRQEVNNAMDMGHMENKRRIKEGFKAYGAMQLMDIETARGRLISVKNKIEQLEAELENSNTYKKGIIDVVSTDFINQRNDIIARLQDAFTKYESAVYLKVDASRFNRIRDDSQVLFFIDAPGIGRQMYMGPVPAGSKLDISNSMRPQGSTPHQFGEGGTGFRTNFHPDQMNRCC